MCCAAFSSEAVSLAVRDTGVVRYVRELRAVRERGGGESEQEKDGEKERANFPFHIFPSLSQQKAERRSEKRDRRGNGGECPPVFSGVRRQIADHFAGLPFMAKRKLLPFQRVESIHTGSSA